MHLQDSSDESGDQSNEEFQQRKEIRNNISRTIVSMETNTIDEIQQVTSVFKQAMVMLFVFIYGKLDLIIFFL